MKKFLIPIFLCILSLNAFSQINYPLVINELGDTININYNIPDTAYVRNEVLIKFKPNGIRLDKLCFTYYENSIDSKSNGLQSISYAQRNELMKQNFCVDSLITNPSLVSIIKLLGGDSLSRITVANPCVDTLSITRIGDTIHSEDFLWLKLNITNDSSAMMLAYLISVNYQSELDLASLNFLHQTDRVPLDAFYTNGKQNGLKSDYLDCEKAWNYETGERTIKVGIIDSGLDYRLCDFGIGLGPYYKVVQGVNYCILGSSFDVHVNSLHGTAMASIIGALTNYNCPTYSSSPSVAGVSGGWGTLGGQSSRGLGVSLYGYKCSTSMTVEKSGFLETKYIIAAIYEASSKSPSGLYGFGNHILNLSFSTSYYDLAEQAAIRSAFQNNVNCVAARGNVNSAEPRYPSSFMPSMVTSVGAYDANWGLADFGGGYKSCWSGYMDFIAPGSNDLVYAMQHPGVNSYFEVNGTSSATAHVSGAMSLLKSTAYRYSQTNRDNIKFNEAEPEDYENILKASCEMIDNTYNGKKAWGPVKIGNVYKKLEEDNYHLKHYSIDENLNYGNWHPNQLKKNFTGIPPKGYIGLKSVDSRLITLNYEINLNEWEMFNNDYPLFVWGRENRGRSGGYSKEEPNWQTRYNGIKSGSGGYLDQYYYGITIEGIIHTNNKTIKLETWQYRDQLTNQIIPDNSEIKFNFSIWGRLKTNTDVSFTTNNYSKLIRSVAKSNSDLSITLFDEIIESNFQIEIFNLLGEKMNFVYYSSGNNFNCNTTGFASGIYFLKISNMGNNEVVKISL